MPHKRTLTPEPAALTAYTNILMARLCLDSGLSEEIAVRHLDRTYGPRKSSIPGWLQWRRAVCYRRAGASAKALYALTCLESEEGLHHRIEYEKALCWMELKDWSKALRAIDNAIGFSPDAFYLELRGDILVETGDIEAALSAFDEACEGVDRVFARAFALQRSELYSRAIQEIDAGLEFFPTEGDLLAQRGELKICLGDLDGARWDFSVALALSKDATTLARRAILNVDQGRLEEAERDARQSIELEPRGALPLRALALVADALGRLSETALYWGRYSEVSSDPEGILLQAEALNRASKHQDCDALLDTYFQRFPDCKHGFYYQAGILRSRRQFRNAELVLDKALGHYPGKHSLMLERVLIYLEWNKLSKADIACTQLLTLHPKSTEGKKLRVEILLARGEASDALQLVDELLLGKVDDEIRLLQARSLVDLGRFKEALEFLEEFEDFGVEHPDYFEIKAYAHAQLGLWDEAAADLASGLNRHREDPGLKFYNLLVAFRRGEFGLSGEGARELLQEDMFYRYRLACRGILLSSGVAHKASHALNRLRHCSRALFRRNDQL